MNLQFMGSTIQAFALALPLSLLPLDASTIAPFPQAAAASEQPGIELLLKPSFPPAVPPNLPTGQQWLDHVKQELLPFWALPTALGDPIGNFPSVRCNDGTLVDPEHPCSEVLGFDGDWLLKDDQYVVALSRQIYTYGVAFQLTGDRKYLDYAKAGVDYFQQHALDREAGGAYALWNTESNNWEPGLAARNPQEQAYALMGLSYYYYLTRDPDILPDILDLKAFIFDTYQNPELGLLQWQLEDTEWGNALDKKLVAQLDQLNAYMMLLAPILPEPEKTEWTQDMVWLSGIMLDQFYLSEENLFLLSSPSPGVSTLTIETDFGHSIKTMWFMRMIGLLSGDQSLVEFAVTNGPKILERAYLPESGTWASGVFPDGTIDAERSWWVHAELDQFTASVALVDPAVATYLPATYQYWFNHFVDPVSGEVWNNPDPLTDEPIGTFPKQWSWKNGYHTFEHALVGYITARQLNQSPTVLYYAFEQLPDLDTIHPYYYKGEIDDITALPQPESAVIYRVNFSNVR